MVVCVCRCVCMCVVCVCVCVCVLCVCVCMCVVCVCVSVCDANLCNHLQLSAKISNASRSQYFYEDQIEQISDWSFILSYGVICSPRQPLMKLSTLQLESLICMIVQLTTPYTGKLAFNDGVKRPVSTPFVHSSLSVLGISSKRCSSSMLRKFNLFLTIIGTVRFLICSGIRLRLNQWRTIKACWVMILNAW